MDTLLRTSIPTLNALFNYLSSFESTTLWIRNKEYNKQLFISPAYETIWQQSCESLYNSPESWSDALLPNEKESIMQQTQHRTQNNAATLANNSVFYRIKTNEEILYIKDWGVPIIENQQLIAYAGLAEKISAESWHNQLEKSAQLHNAFLEHPLAHDFLSILTKELPLRTSEPMRVISLTEILQCREVILQGTGYLLTPREIECCYYLCLGKTAKEIAKIMHLSFRTIEKYIENAIKNTQSTRRTDLVQKISHYF